MWLIGRAGILQIGSTYGPDDSEAGGIQERTLDAKRALLPFGGIAPYGSGGEDESLGEGA